MSGIDLISKAHTLDPDAPAPTEPDTWQNDPPTAELLAKSWINNAANPLRQRPVAAKGHAGRRVYPGRRDASGLHGEMLLRQHAQRGDLANRVVEGRSFPLADIKAIDP